MSDELTTDNMIKELKCIQGDSIQGRRVVDWTDETINVTACTRLDVLGTASRGNNSGTVRELWKRQRVWTCQIRRKQLTVNDGTGKVRAALDLTEANDANR